MEISQKPQRLLDLVISIVRIVALNYAAYVITNREGLVSLLLVYAAFFAPTKPFFQDFTWCWLVSAGEVFPLVKCFLNKSYQALKQL